MVFTILERPLLRKAAVQIFDVEKSLESVRFAPDSGQSDVTMLKGRKRPKADITDLPKNNGLSYPTGKLTYLY